MKKLSVHTNRKLTPNLKHNDRSTKEKHANVFEEKMHLNEIDKSAKEAMQEINTLYKEAMQKLEGKKGKRTPKENSYTEMIFEVDENHTLEDCQKLADEICKLTGFRRIQVSLHKDEGHYEEDGTFKTHHHAHAVFFTLDEKDGKQLARREKGLSDSNLSKFQDLAYEILRGEVRVKSKDKKEYVSDYREHKKLQKIREELNQREQDITTREQRLKDKELKEREYNHYQELLELQEHNYDYLSIPLSYDILQDVEELGNDIYTPLRNIYTMEFINFLSLKTGLNMVFDGFADNKCTPIVFVKYGKDQRKLSRQEFLNKLRENLPSDKDISNFETFQALYHLTTILRDNHKTFQAMGLTESLTPTKVKVHTEIAKSIKRAISIALSR